MFRPAIRNLLLIGSAAIAGASKPAPKSLLHSTRQSPQDLEVTGLIRGLPIGESAYVRYSDLLALPQTKAVIADDPDIPGPVHVSGVSFETLASALNVLPQSDLVDALCSDRYRSHFPADYIAQHHPILVLTIDQKPLAAWAESAHQRDPSPYLVMYSHFVPTFKILAHQDQPQLPDNLLRLNFTTQSQTFGPITPHGNFPPNSPELQGFAIAKQNCLRCHFQGTSGGTKSGRSWQVVGTWAREQPAFFQAYVKNPTKFEPRSHMAPNPEYDAATLAALTAYFRTFSTSTKAGTP
jgi:hypothetical protein